MAASPVLTTASTGMARAVELRAQGWSLRRIGTELAVSEFTIRQDLKRWEREQLDALVELYELRCSGAIYRSNIAPEHRTDIAEEEDK